MVQKCFLKLIWEMGIIRYQWLRRISWKLVLHVGMVHFSLMLYLLDFLQHQQRYREWWTRSFLICWKIYYVVILFWKFSIMHCPPSFFLAKRMGALYGPLATSICPESKKSCNYFLSSVNSTSSSGYSFLLGGGYFLSIRGILCSKI